MGSLNLDLNSVYVQKTPEGSEHDEYIKRLEEEMRKIDGLKRELPLSMLLLKNAIAILEKQAAAAMQCTVVQEDEEEAVKRGYDLNDKREWMSAVQLWSSDINCDSMKHDTVLGPKLLRNGGGVFVPLKEQFGFPRTEGKDVLLQQVLGLPPLTPAMNLDLIRSDGRKMSLHHRRPQKNQLQRRWRASTKKGRRNWSAELHKLFLEALDKLGGSRVATPKLIKQAMKVDGLTSDEIKSHLQKYRIHLKSPTKPCADKRPWMVNDQPGDFSNPSDSSQSQSHVPSGSANGISMSGGSCMCS